MACNTMHCVFYNYIKANTIIGNVFYIEADGKTKSPYMTVQCVDDPDINTILSTDDGETNFLISIFQSAYTKGINNRKGIIDYIRLLRGGVVNNFKIWKVEIINSWDRGEKVDGLFSFNFEVCIKWEKV